MAKSTREITDRRMVMHKEVSRTMTENVRLKCLFFATLLLCIAMSAQATAKDVPLLRFDSEPVNEAATERAMTPNQPKLDQGPATDAIGAARSSSSIATIHDAVF